MSNGYICWHIAEHPCLFQQMLPSRRIVSVKRFTKPSRLPHFRMMLQSRSTGNRQPALRSGCFITGSINTIGATGIRLKRDPFGGDKCYAGRIPLIAAILSGLRCLPDTFVPLMQSGYRLQSLWAVDINESGGFCFASFPA